MNKRTSLILSKGATIQQLSIVLCMFVCFGNAGRCDAPFPDVPRNHWAYQAVEELRQKGILLGYPTGTTNVHGQGLFGKQTYDLSSPEKAWNSLLRAMRQGDEDGINQVLTDDCYSADGNLSFTFKFISDDPAVRKREYRDRAKRWSKREFHTEAFGAGTDSDDATYAIALDLDSMRVLSPGEEITFRKYSNSWRITQINRNME